MQVRDRLAAHLQRDHRCAARSAFHIGTLRMKSGACGGRRLVGAVEGDVLAAWGAACASASTSASRTPLNAWRCRRRRAPTGCRRRAACGSERPLPAHSSVTSCVNIGSLRRSSRRRTSGLLDLAFDPQRPLRGSTARRLVVVAHEEHVVGGVVGGQVGEPGFEVDGPRAADDEPLLAGDGDGRRLLARRRRPSPEPGGGHRDGAGGDEKAATAQRIRPGQSAHGRRSFASRNIANETTRFVPPCLAAAGAYT